MYININVHDIIFKTPNIVYHTNSIKEITTKLIVNENNQYILNINEIIDDTGLMPYPPAIKYSA